MDAIHEERKMCCCVGKGARLADDGVRDGDATCEVRNSDAIDGGVDISHVLLVLVRGRESRWPRRESKVADACERERPISKVVVEVVAPRALFDVRARHRHTLAAMPGSK